MRLSTTMFCATLALAAPAMADFDLQITEIWPGNEPGSNLTSDWIEVTNFGSMPWSIADGALYFDDESGDVVDAALISGVTSIAPGESVVFIDDDTTTEFETVWGAAIAGVQLGTYDGSGMSQGGDGATLWVSDGLPLANASNWVSVDLELYPDANAFGGRSYDVVLGSFSVLAPGAEAFASAIANDEGQFAIASPGAIPEPTSVALVALAAATLGLTRRV